MIRTLFISIAFLLCAQLILAQSPTLEMLVNKDSVLIDSEFQLSIVLKGSNGTIIPPSFKNFKIISGPRITEYDMDMYGKRSQETQHTYWLKSTKIGQHTIAPAGAQTRSGTIKSEPLDIAVLEQLADDSLSSELDNIEVPYMPYGYALIAEVDRDNIILGEVVNVQYYLYSVSDNIDIETYDILPKHAGFINLDETIDNPQWQSNGDRSVFRTKLAEQHLIAQGIGRQVIEPYEVVLTIPVHIYGMDLRRTLSKKQYIQVNPIPEGATTAFTGGIGQFKIEATVGADSIELGESSEVKVAISGHGNLSAIDAPIVQVPDGLSISSPIVRDDYKLSSEGLKGKRIFTYPIQSNAAGPKQLPLIQFQYFDTEERAYKLLSIQPPPLVIKNSASEATKGLSESADADDDDNINEKAETVITDTKDKLKDVPWLPIGIGFGVLSLIWLLVLRLKKRQKEKAALGPNAMEIATDHLHSARIAMENGADSSFYSSLYQAMNLYMSKKLQIPVAQLNRGVLKQKLGAASISESTQTAWQSALDQCESAAYAPGGVSEPQRLYQEVSQLIKEIDRKL